MKFFRGKGGKVIMMIVLGVFVVSSLASMVGLGM